MGKKQIVMIMLVAAFSVGIISLYTTFAYDEEAAHLGESNATYNLIYSIKNSSSKKITVNAKEEKFVDISLTNTHDGSLKYGMYYKILSGGNNQNIVVNIAEDSQDPLQSTIEVNETKVVSLRIKNEGDSNIELVVGALVGFVQGKIEDLQKDGEILIK